MLELFSDHTFRTVFFGTCMIGAISGALGCFAYLRKQSLIGDVVSHSSLLGIMVFFLIGYWITGEGSKSLFVLIPGAITAGVASVLMARWIINQGNIREDSGLGVMLTIFFGTGIALLRWVQHTSNPPIPGRRGLDSYLFGMAAAMTWNDLIMIAGLGLVSLFAMLVFWKELKVFSFDLEFAHSIGFKTGRMDVLLTLLLVMGVVIGIQCVGVVLMIALLITPAAAARQWTDSLGRMTALAALIGALCGGVGTVLSAQISNMPTGPVVVLVGIVIFSCSLTFAPRRGVIAQKFLRRKTKPEGVGAC